MYADCLQLRVDDLHKDLAEADADAKDLLAVAMGEKPAQEAAAAKQSALARPARAPGCLVHRGFRVW